jgi:hypothetical protein
MLFEPVTMRNLETALEKSLLYPNRAVNIMDLVFVRTDHDPEESGRICGLLRKKVLIVKCCLPGTMRKLREEWEADKKNEAKGLELAQVYNDLGKSAQACEVLEKLRRTKRTARGFTIGGSAFCGANGDRKSENRVLSLIFATNAPVQLDNGKTYFVKLSSGVSTDATGDLVFDVLAADSAGNEVKIVSTADHGSEPFLADQEKDYKLDWVDSVHGLAVYVLPQLGVVIEPDTGVAYLNKGLTSCSRPPVRYTQANADAI